MSLQGVSREARVGSSRDLERGAAGRAAAPRPALSHRPRRLVERCCPFVGRWLGTLGYEEALVVRDKTHLFLYITCAVSLGCSLMWMSDVWSGGCLIQEPWLNEAEKWAAFNCIFEIVGAVIFLGTLRDSIQMIGNYDNEHQELLQRKNEMMTQLQNQVMDALHKAQQNADELCKMLFEMYEAKINNHVKVLFKNVLPTLHRNCDLEVLQKITYLLGCNLGEPGQLAAALYGQLLDAYKKMGLETDPATAGPPAFWTEWLRTRLPKELANAFCEPSSPRRPVPRTHSTQSTASLLSTRSAASTVTAPAVLIEPAAANDGQQVFEPLRSVVGLAEAFTRSTLFHKQAPEVPEKLLGCGRSPWHGDTEGDQSCCCIPRLLAHLFKLICCPCVCLCDIRCQSAFSYPKKVTFGCFWFQIVSKLHERLIHGLVLSVSYVAIYIWRTSIITEDGCPDNANFTQCFWDMVRRSCMMVALLLQIPALFFCLVRIKELDAIIRIMADIRKLEDIRGVVRNLDENVQLAVEKKSLVEALDQRVLVRVNLVQRFRQHLFSRTAQDVHADFRGSAQGLLEFLVLADEMLGPARRWMDLTPEERARLGQQVKDASEALEERNFQPADEMVPTGPNTIEIRLPENAAGGGMAGRKKPLLRG